MDIQKQIQDSVNNVLAEKVPAMIDKAVESMVDKVISDIFSNWGDMSKSVKEKIESKLDVSLDKYDMTDYNGFVSMAIKKAISNQMEEGCIAPIESMVRGIIGRVEEKEVSISKLSEMLIKAHMDDSYDDSGEFTMIVKENKNHQWIEVFIDPEPNKRDVECSCKFIASNSEYFKRIFSISTRRHYFAGIENNGYRFEEMTPTMMANIDSFSNIIFRLYAAQVDIIFDDDEPETYWSRSDW